MAPKRRWGALGSTFLAVVSIVHADALMVRPATTLPPMKKIGCSGRGPTRALGVPWGGGDCLVSKKDDSTAAATRAGRVVAVSAGLGSLLQG
jgi:hypothetical protein